VCPGCGSRRVRLYRESLAATTAASVSGSSTSRSAKTGPADSSCGLSESPSELPLRTYGAGFGRVPPKPKGMHWRTYYRLADELQRAAAGSLSSSRLIRKLGLDPPLY
jgi:hypothetical protein